MHKSKKVASKHVAKQQLITANMPPRWSVLEIKIFEKTENRGKFAEIIVLVFYGYFEIGLI